MGEGEGEGEGEERFLMDGVEGGLGGLVGWLGL